MARPDEFEDLLGRRMSPALPVPGVTAAHVAESAASPLQDLGLSGLEAQPAPSFSRAPTSADRIQDFESAILRARESDQSADSKSRIVSAIASIFGADPAEVRRLHGSPGNEQAAIDRLKRFQSGEQFEQQQKMGDLRIRGAEGDIGHKESLRDPMSQDSRAVQETFPEGIAPEETLFGISAANREAITNLRMQDKSRQLAEGEERDFERKKELERMKAALRKEASAAKQRLQSGAGDENQTMRDLRTVVEGSLVENGMDPQSAQVLSSTLEGEKLQQVARDFASRTIGGLTRQEKLAKEHRTMGAQFSKEAVREGIPQFNARMAMVENAARQLTPNEKRFAIGFMKVGSPEIQGALSIPQQKFVQGLKAVEDFVLRDRTGAAITDPEIVSLRQEFGSSVIDPDAVLRALEGIKRERRAVEATLRRGFRDVAGPVTVRVTDKEGNVVGKMKIGKEKLDEAEDNARRKGYSVEVIE